MTTTLLHRLGLVACAALALLIVTDGAAVARPALDEATARGDGAPVAIPGHPALAVPASTTTGRAAVDRAFEEIQLAGPVHRVSRRTARRTSRRHELVYD